MKRISGEIFRLLLNLKGCLVVFWENELLVLYKVVGVLISIFVDWVWKSNNWIRNRMKCWKGKFGGIIKGIDECFEGCRVWGE